MSMTVGRAPLRSGIRSVPLPRGMMTMPNVVTNSTLDLEGSEFLPPHVKALDLIGSTNMVGLIRMLQDTSTDALLLWKHCADPGLSMDRLFMSAENVKRYNQYWSEQRSTKSVNLNGILEDLEKELLRVYGEPFVVDEDSLQVLRMFTTKGQVFHVDCRGLPGFCRNADLVSVAVALSTQPMTLVAPQKLDTMDKVGELIQQQPVINLDFKTRLKTIRDKEKQQWIDANNWGRGKTAPMIRALSGISFNAKDTIHRGSGQLAVKNGGHPWYVCPDTKMDRVTLYFSARRPGVAAAHFSSSPFATFVDTDEVVFGSNITLQNMKTLRSDLLKPCWQPLLVIRSNSRR